MKILLYVDCFYILIGIPPQSNVLFVKYMVINNDNYICKLYGNKYCLNIKYISLKLIVD